MLVPTTSTQPTMSSFTASSAAKSIFGAPLLSSLTWTFATFWSFSLLCRVWLYSLCAWKYRYPAVARRAMPTTRKTVLNTLRSRCFRLGRCEAPTASRLSWLARALADASCADVSGSKPTAPRPIVGTAAGDCAVSPGC